MNIQRSYLSSWFSLFTSMGTLVCCALPALFVSIGAGAALAGLISAAPSLVWLSEYKGVVFGFCAFMLVISGYMQWQNRYAPCPVDPALAAACTKTRRVSLGIYLASVAIFVIGAFFAFVLPELTK